MLVKVKEIKEKNKSLPNDKQIKYSLKRKSLFINNELQRNKIQPLSVADVMSISEKEALLTDKLPLAASDAAKEKGSFFTSYAVEVSSFAGVHRAYRRIKLYHPDADHIISASRTPSFNGGHDDREYGASLWLQKMLEDRNETNKAVFVARVFAGSKMLSTHGERGRISARFAGGNSQKLKLTMDFHGSNSKLK